MVLDFNCISPGRVHLYLCSPVKNGYPHLCSQVNFTLGSVVAWLENCTEFPVLHEKECGKCLRVSSEFCRAIVKWSKSDGTTGSPPVLVLPSGRSLVRLLSPSYTFETLAIVHA